ncbi:MAG: DUF2911 domain-containing protein [Vicinamibacterales bacterium]|nr:DUF2911 domain-containing protein [Vicinamibacterales bacterium]
MRRFGALGLAAALVAGLGIVASAQMGGARPASAPGTAQTELGGEWVKGERGMSYQGGKWIEVVYNRPVLRQRENIFGSGAEYGQALNAGAPLWRAGANQSTRFKTEVALNVGGKTLPAGEYSVFVELKPAEWTLIFSSWDAQQKFDKADTTALWGAYGYTPDKDVLRATMTVTEIPYSVDEFTISFINVTKSGGELAMVWDRTLATVPFTLAGS